MPGLSREEIEVAAKVAVVETFRMLGIDVSDRGIFEAQRDFAHLRRWRLIVEKSTLIAIAAVTTASVSGVLAAVWLAVKASAH